MNLLKIRNMAFGLLRQDGPEAGAISYPIDLVNAFINAGHREMIEVTGNTESYASLAVTAGTRSVDVPADFESVKQLNYKYSGAANAWPLKPLPFQDFDWTWGGRGRPVYYIYRQGKIWLAPTPNTSSATLDLYYYTIPVDMEDNTDEPEIPASFHHYLAYYAAYMCKLRDRDPQRADTFKREWEVGKKELRIRTLYERNNQEFGQVRNDYYGNNDYLNDMWI